MTTLQLRPVSSPKGDANRYCGPAVLSALTGMATGEAARLLRKLSGRSMVTGTHDVHLLRALGFCGIIAKPPRLFRKPQPTLAAWLKETAGQRGGKVWLISAGNHWQLVSGNRYVCGQSGEVVGLDHAKVKRRARVRAVWLLESPLGVKVPAVARKPQPTAQARQRAASTAKARVQAQALARAWGVTVERHMDLASRPWFVIHRELKGPGDPHAGDHYVHSWEEVLERVRDYVTALQALGREPQTVAA